MEPLRLYFDFLSPYAYLANAALPELAARVGRPLERVPVLLAALLAANGQRGPAEIPRKRVYVFKDVVRLAALRGLPLTPPASHPFNPLLSLRVSSAPMSSEARALLVDGLFGAAWGGGRADLGDEATVRAALEAAGLDAPSILAWAQGPEGKQAVRVATEQLLEKGGFGVPMIEADGELFFGYDSLPHVERYLRGEDPVRAEDVARWMDLPATASRRV